METSWPLIVNQKKWYDYDTFNGHNVQIIRGVRNSFKVGKA